MTPRDAARLLGKLGGAAGKGAAKRRTREHYARGANARAVKTWRCPHCGREIRARAALGLFNHAKACGA